MSLINALGHWLAFPNLINNCYLWIELKFFFNNSSFGGARKPL